MHIYHAIIKLRIADPLIASESLICLFTKVRMAIFFLRIMAVLYSTFVLHVHIFIVSKCLSCIIHGF